MELIASQHYPKLISLYNKTTFSQNLREQAEPINYVNTFVRQ